MNILTTELVNNYEYYKKLVLMITNDKYHAEEALHTAFLRLLGFRTVPENPAAYVTTHLKHLARYQRSYTFSKQYLRTNVGFKLISMKPTHERYMLHNIETPLGWLEAKEAAKERYKTISDYPGIQYHKNVWDDAKPWAAVVKGKRIGMYKTEQEAINALNKYNNKETK